MRIALFSGNYNYLREGANQALNRLVAFAEGRGHAVRVYSPVTGTPAFEPKGELVPVPSMRLPVRGEFRLATGLPRRIREDVRRFGPDLIHVSTPDILGARAQTFAKRLGVPIVASMHTRFETYFEHYGLAWARPLAEAHLRRFYRRSDHVLAPTPGLVRAMKQLRGDEHVSLFSRGVDRSLFSPARRDPAWRASNGWDDDDVVLLFFGRLVLEKGVKEFGGVVRYLARRGISVRPLVVGAGPAEALFRELDDALLTGHLEAAALARAIASADILLHPSTTETFGNVMLEAMASGLAIVCADSDGARTMAEPGASALFCEPGRIDALADAVAALAGDPVHRRTLGSAAREASARFNWDEACAGVLEPYRDVVARQRQRIR